MSRTLVTDRRIGVLMGGMSAERDISLKSGRAIYDAIAEMGYNAVLIDVDRDIVSTLRREEVKLAFLALHGGSGENGAMQGLLDVTGIPYTGSGVLASALAMNKEMAKKVFSIHGFYCAPFIVVRKTRDPFHENVIDGSFSYTDYPLPEFDLPWVVKPSEEGSSIGVHIVRDREDLNNCLEDAFKYGDRAIVEQFISGRELHIGVLGARVLGGVEVRPSKEFYNFEAKYTSGLTDYILPPDVDSAAYESAKKMALKAHQVMGCAGVTRVDFIVDSSNRPYILEVNTLPGMTTTSLIPKIARSAGMEFNELIEEIINLATKKEG